MNRRSTTAVSCKAHRAIDNVGLKHDAWSPRRQRPSDSRYSHEDRELRVDGVQDTCTNKPTFMGWIGPRHEVRWAWFFYQVIFLPIRRRINKQTKNNEHTDERTNKENFKYELIFLGTLVNTTYGTHKNHYISLFLLPIFGPIYYSPPK